MDTASIAEGSKRITNNRICLITPPVFRNTEAISPEYMRGNHAFNYPPLGLLYLASNLPAEYDCRTIDAPTLQYSPEKCFEAIKSFDPFIVGIATFSDSLYSSRHLAEEIKRYDKNIQIVFGGPHVNIYPEETLSWYAGDYVLTGFCENSFASLVDHISGKNGGLEKETIPGLWWREEGTIRKSSVAQDPSWDINAIRRPDRRKLEYKKYFTLANQQTIATMITSRGCPFHCTFCDVFEKKFHVRDIEDIVKEVEEILALGIRQIHIFDDCFNLKRQRAIEICEAFIKRKLDFEWSFRGRIEPCDEELVRLLYKAGCRRVQLGIEATDQETIKLINKKIDLAKVPDVLRIYRANNIETMGYFIIGFPHQNYEKCEDSCKQIMRMGFDYVNMFILIPYPNTAIYREVLNSGWLDDDYWRCHAIDPTPDFKLPKWHRLVERKNLDKLLNAYYRKFYFSPRFIYAELKRTKSVYNLLMKMKMFVVMMISSRQTSKNSSKCQRGDG